MTQEELLEKYHRDLIIAHRECEIFLQEYIDLAKEFSDSTRVYHGHEVCRKLCEAFNSGKKKVEQMKIEVEKELA